MTDSVLIISKLESFMVNAIKNKLEASGLMCTFVSTDSPNICAVIDDRRVIILYVDESIFEKQDLLIYLKDKCNDDDLKLIIIGSPSDFNTLSNYISDNYLAGKLERPIEMQEVIGILEGVQGAAQEDRDKKSILIVDDDATYLRTIRDWLKDKYRVIMANSGIQAVENEIGKIDIAIGCAAVADYKVANSADKKITKEDSGDELTLKLVRNPDIIATVGKLEVNRPYTVGFAAETNDGEEHARNKLNKKNLDLIVLNNVLQKGIGFGSDDNEVSVYDRDGLVAHLDLQPKRAIADKLIELIFTGAKEFLSRKN